MKIVADKSEFIVIIITNHVDSGEKKTQTVGCDLRRNPVACHFIIWAGFDICGAPSPNISHHRVCWLQLSWWWHRRHRRVGEKKTQTVGCDVRRNPVACYFIICAGFDICGAPSPNISHHRVCWLQLSWWWHRRHRRVGWLQFSSSCR